MSDKQKNNAQKTKQEQWDAMLRVVELFRRYFSGEASQRERNSIDTWEPIEDESGLLNDKALKKECDTASVWNAVAHELKFDRQPRFFTKKHFSIGKLQWRIAAAAVILILLGSGIFYYTQNDFIRHTTGAMAEAKTSFQTTTVQTKLLTLPDGTRIQMNRETKISYAINTFNHTLREVWLTGEAFFEVAKNHEKPFIIHTGTMQTIVRGTSFNVKAYGELGENVVSVRDGRVEIVENSKILGVLTANHQLKYHTADGVTEINNTDWQDAAGWIEGRLVLNEASAKELCLRLRQQFGVTARIENDALSGRLLSGTFRKESTLKEVMTTIGAIHQVHYKIRDRQVTITP